MYSYFILVFLIMSPIILGIIFMMSGKEHLSKYSIFLIMGSFVLAVLCLIIGIIDSHQNLSQEISSSKQVLALNSNHRPMYDIIYNSDDSNNDPSIAYRVQLKSGKTKTVSPKVVHVNRSKESYLQATHRLQIIDIFGLKFKAGAYTENKLYLNDK